MALQLNVPPQFGRRFNFVFSIGDMAPDTRVRGQVYLYEYSEFKASLEVVERGSSRLQVAEELMRRCLSWAELRIDNDRRCHRARTVQQLNAPSTGSSTPLM